MSRKRYSGKSYKNSYKSSHKPKQRKKSRYSALEKFAFNMGRIELGLKGDTKVADSYKLGATRPQPKEKKAKKPAY